MIDTRREFEKYWKLEHNTKKHTSSSDRQQEKKWTKEKDELSMKTDKETFIIRIQKLKEDIRAKEIINTVQI